jgi:hypothetical protein
VSATQAAGQLAPKRSWVRRASERLIVRPGRTSLLPLAAVVVGLALAALGMFRGAPAPLAEVPAGYVALVNQKGVLESDFISQVETATMKRFDEATPEEKARVLRSMIDEELLVQRAMVLDLPETTIEVREAMQQGVEAQVAEPYWSLPPTDAELRAYYDKTRSDYTNDGTMIVHDLVMHVGGFQNANQSTPQALSDAADAVYRLRSGASVDYAKEHYGFVDSNRLPAVEELDFVVKMRLGDKLFEVASALGNGEISDPVIDVDGVHVLVMDVRRPASVADFSSVRDKVYQAYRRVQGERATAENVKLLRSQAQIILAPGQEE